MTAMDIRTSDDESQIETAAARIIWDMRDILRISSSMRMTGDVGWEHRTVQAGPITYQPVVDISPDLATATACLSTPAGTLSLPAGRGPASEAWEAALAWRILRRMTGKDPVERETVVVSRPNDGRLLSRVRWLVSPTMILTSRSDVMLNELTLAVAKHVEDTQSRPADPDATTFEIPLPNGVTLMRQGRRRPVYQIDLDSEGGVTVPRRLVALLDMIAGVGAREAMRAA